MYAEHGGRNFKGALSGQSLQEDLIGDASKFIKKYKHGPEFLAQRKFDSKRLDMYVGNMDGDAAAGLYIGKTGEEGGALGRFKSRDKKIKAYEQGGGLTRVMLDGMGKMQVANRARFGKDHPNAAASFHVLRVSREHAASEGTSLFLFGCFLERLLANVANPRSANNDAPTMQMPRDAVPEYNNWAKKFSPPNHTR